MDNGTAMEVLKSLNYCQLAKTSLVSMRFRDLIRNNRHRLALHYVSGIMMDLVDPSLLCRTIFDKDFSSEEYEEWVTRNQYSKQIPLESQISGMGSYTGWQGWVYQLYANAGQVWVPGSVAYFVRAELNHDNWPLFQHFIRLITDPFNFLRYMSFDWIAQKDCFNLLSGIINPDRNCLQCDEMKLSAKDPDLDFSNLITWVKCHLLCNDLEIDIYSVGLNRDGLNHDEALLDIILTGGHCTSALNITNYELSKVLLDLAEKFMDFKIGDECKIVESIKGDINKQNVEEFKRHLGKFIVKEKRNVDEINDESKELVFEFVNKDIDQKCQFTATYK